MFLGILFTLLSFGDILLETNGMLFNLSDKSNVQKDGSIILTNKSTALHLDKNGKEINRIGDSGDGPGEFRYLSEAHWDGQKYYLHDWRRNDVSVFSSEGEFLKRSRLNVRDLFFVGDTLFGSDYLPFVERNRDGKPLIELSFTPENTIKPTGRAFHFIHPVIFKFHTDEKRYFVDESSGLYYVMTELSPDISVYNKDLKLLRQHKATLFNYIPPGKPWDIKSSQKEFFKILRSFSQIEGLVAHDEKIAVLYFVPNVQDSEEPLLYTQILDAKGSALGRGWKIDGSFIGGYQDNIYTVVEDDDLNYYLKITSF